MTNTREMLKLAAKAMGIELDQDFPDEAWTPLFYDDSLDRWKAWNPLTESGDCAELCAALGIDSDWYTEAVVCSKHDDRMSNPHCIRTERPTDHANNRAAAWRMAALRVAAEIGRAM